MYLNQSYHETDGYEPITVERVRAALDARGCKPRRDKGGYRAICPAHSGADGHNFTVHPNRDGGVLLHCHSHHCEYQDILKSLGLWEEPRSNRRIIDKGSARDASHQNTPIEIPWQIERDSTVYQYRNPDGVNLYQNVRKPGKQFRARRFDEGGMPIWNLEGIEQVPYGLPELLDKRFQQLTVHVCEGEKDAITLRDRGFLAVSLASGALIDANLKYFKNRNVVIHEDNDRAGSEKSAKVLAWLDGTATSIRTMRYTDLPEKGDVTDWFAAGNDIRDFARAIEALPVHTPETPAATAPEWEPPIPLSKSVGPALDPRALPEKLRAFCEALAASLQVPFDMAVTGALGSLSSAVIGKFVVKHRWPEPVHIMAVNVALPGTRKSPLMSALTGALYRLQKEQQQRDHLALAEWESVQRSLKRQQDSLEREPRKGEHDGEARDMQRRATVQELHEHELTKPVINTFIVDDVTPEKVAWMLTEQPGVTVTSAESAYLENFYRYGDTPNFNVFLQGHAADPVSIHRRNGEDATVERACLGLNIAIQPDSLIRMGGVQGFMERGGTARLLMTIPPDMVGTRLTGADVPAMPESLNNWWDGVLTDLLERRSSAASTLAILMTPEATARADELSEICDQRAKAVGSDSPMRAWILKQAGAALRLAGLLHLIENTHAEPISGDTMQRAIELSEWYRAHAEVALAMMGGTQEESARIVWEALSENGEIEVSRRDLHHRLQGRSAFKRAKDLDEPLTILEEYGYIRTRKEGTGGRPTVIIELNPLAMKIPQMESPLEFPHIVRTPETVKPTSSEKGTTEWTF